MGGFIPEEILENIRMRVDIVQLISSYVHLEKRGSNYVGPCPFHQESDPSFTVTPSKQIFYCFGCQQGGNAFKFIMMQHQVSFPEAVRILGEQVGVEVPDNYSPGMRQRLQRHEKAWKINALAKAYYHDLLLEHSGAAAAREYLAQRGVTPEIVREFGLGFAPGNWDSLIKFMAGQGFNAGDLVDVGLAVAGERKPYDRFRSRLMFPIADFRGRVVGFGGRVIGAGTPKYLNTSETDYFSKGKVLYGLDKARPHISNLGYAVITEGYMDVIAAHQYGISNAVASLGTSLTREHGQLLVNYAKEILIAYDADTAGIAATLRGLDILQSLGCRVRVISLPRGQDPDDFLRNQGVESWRQLVEQAVSLVEFKLQTTLEKYKGLPTSKELVLEEILPTLAAVQGELEKNEIIKLVASRLYTSYHAVAEQLKIFTSKKPKTGINSDKIVKNKHNKVRKNRADYGERAEYGLLKLMLEDVKLVDSVAQALPGNFFKDEFCHQVYKKILASYRQPSFAPSVLFDELEEDYQQKLGMLLVEPIPGDDVHRLLEGYLAAIKRRQLMEHRDGLMKALNQAEKSGDTMEVMRILEAINIAEKP